MKNLLSTISLAAIFMSVPLLAQEVQIVVQTKSLVNSALTQSAQTQPIKGCITTPNGKGQWCLNIDLAAAKKSKTNDKLKSHSVYKAITLNGHGYDANMVAKLLNEDGRFGFAEVDFVVTTQTSTPLQYKVSSASAQPPTDDPDAHYQESYYTDPGSSPVGMGVYKAWQSHNALESNSEGEKLDIIVLDTSFFESQDMPYFDGRSFSTVALETGEFDEDGMVIKKAQPRNNDYSPRKDNELYPACNGHGLGVASTIASPGNNQLGISGVINNVNLYAIRVMTCGTGRLSDTADALIWLSNETNPDEYMSESDDVKPYTGNPGVVNLSLAASSPNCPNYLQSAIDKVIDKGFSVVAAAANYGHDASNNSPGNCEGVITVGALTAEGELASFSNYGKNLDVSVLGDGIVAMSRENTTEPSWWSGTSFATPLVSGILAAAKRETGATDAQLKLALKMTATQFKEGTLCDTLNCGAGMANMHDMIEAAGDLVDGTLSTISFALDDKTACEQSWFINNFKESVPMCSLYKIKFLGGYATQKVSYKLLSVEAGSALDEVSAVTIGEFNDETIYLENIDVKNYDYGFQICVDGECQKELYVLNTALAQEEHRAAACK
jgi:serine protease